MIPSFHGQSPYGANMGETHVLTEANGRARADWSSSPSPWLQDVPADGGNVHVPGLTELPIRFDEGPPWRSKAYHVPAWYRGSDRKRVALLRKYATEYGRDPRLRQFTIKHVIAPAGILFPSRQYEAQAAAILAWVQQNIAYVNEPGELIQGPWHTLKIRSGDCDDLAALVAAMAESIGLGWRYVLGGAHKSGRPVRWAEGQKEPAGCKFFHIYLDLGWPALRPKVWKSAEPTMPVPLGWDVSVHGVPNSVRMPEMEGHGPSPHSRMNGLGVPLDAQLGALHLPALPSMPEAKQYGKDVLKLAVVGALAQVMLLLFMRSKLGKKIKHVGARSRKNPRATKSRRTRRNHCGCGGGK